MSRGVDRRRSSDPALLWLWRRPVAVVLIGPLAWEPPYTMRAALEKAKRQKNKNKKYKNIKNPREISSSRGKKKNNQKFGSTQRNEEH